MPIRLVCVLVPQYRPDKLVESFVGVVVVDAFADVVGGKVDVCVLEAVVIGLVVMADVVVDGSDEVEAVVDCAVDCVGIADVRTDPDGARLVEFIAEVSSQSTGKFCEQDTSFG